MTNGWYGYILDRHRDSRILAAAHALHVGRLRRMPERRLMRLHVALRVYLAACLAVGVAFALDGRLADHLAVAADRFLTYLGV